MTTHCLHARLRSISCICCTYCTFCIVAAACVAAACSMDLLPPPNQLHEYTSIDLLVKDINKHAAKQGYAVIRGRSKPSKLGVKMKY